MAVKIESLGDGGGTTATGVDGQIAYYVVPAGMKVSIPDAGTTATVKYSFGSEQAIRDATVTWTTWPAKGHANAAYTWTSLVTVYRTYFQVTASGSAPVVTVSVPTTDEVGPVFARVGNNLADGTVIPSMTQQALLADPAANAGALAAWAVSVNDYLILAGIMAAS